MWLREPLSLVQWDGVKGVVQLARVVALSQFEPIEDRFHTGVEVIWLTAPVFYVEFGRFEAGAAEGTGSGWCWLSTKWWEEQFGS